MTQKFKVHSRGCSAVGKVPGLEEKGPVFFLKHTAVTSPPPNLWDFIIMGDAFAIMVYSEYFSGSFPQNGILVYSV